MVAASIACAGWASGASASFSPGTAASPGSIQLLDRADKAAHRAIESLKTVEVVAAQFKGAITAGRSARKAAAPQRRDLLSKLSHLLLESVNVIRIAPSALR